jgi:adenylate cyclase, class 2
MAHSGRETEIKLAVPNAGAAASLLQRAGFRVSVPQVFERNTVFDTPEQGLRTAGALLRVREAGAATLTYKGPADAASKYKSREEVELGVADPRAMIAILGRLGFQPIFRYEKRRTEYRRDAGGGVATLDETPIGVYLELEGDPEWIDSTAALLGFDEGDYIKASYGSLYLEWCGRRAIQPTHMVFE